MTLGLLSESDGLMAKRSKPIAPRPEFDHAEFVNWTPSALYGQIRSMRQVDLAVIDSRRSGKPREALKAIQELLVPEAVEREYVLLNSPTGEPGCIPVKLCASLLFATRNTEVARDDCFTRWKRSKIDLVRVIGSRSVNFCTAYVGLVFSISGKSRQYPPVAMMQNGGCPCHVGCTKSFVAYVEELATDAVRSAAILPREDLAIVDPRLSEAMRLEAAKRRTARIV